MNGPSVSAIIIVNTQKDGDWIIVEGAIIVFVEIAVGVFIVIAIIRYRRLTSAMFQEILEVYDYRAKSFDEIIRQDPKLKDFILEAKQAGASHIANDGVVTFYRLREGKYESRSLDYSPGGYWIWISNWQMCKEMPGYALTIPETI